MIDFVHKPLFSKNSVKKDLIIETEDGIIITNTTLHNNSFSLKSSISSDNSLVFGTCESDCVKFTIANIAQSLIGKKLTITMYLNEDFNNPLQIGKYYVYSDIPTANKQQRVVTCYDAMRNILNTDMTAWQNSLTYPISLKNYRDSFFSYFGIEQVEETLDNDDLMILESSKIENITGKDIIFDICELNGCFGHINNQEQFKYIFLKEEMDGIYPSSTLFPSDELFPRSASTVDKVTKNTYLYLEYEKYITKKIDKLIIKSTENDIGVIYPQIENAINTYTTNGNHLLLGKTSEEIQVVAQKMFDIISRISYTPFSTKTLGNPCVEVGDMISCFADERMISTFVLNRSLSGLQALYDEFEAKGTEYYQQRNNTVNRSLKQLNGRTNELIRELEITKSTITGITENMETIQSEVTQQAGEIDLKVSKANIIAEINLSTEEGVTISADKINLQGLVEAEAFTTAYASVGDLNAINTRVQYIEANYITAYTVSANYASITQLNAVDAKFANLNANNITSGTLSAARIDVGGIISSTTFTGASITVQGVNAVGGIFSGGITVQGHALSFKSVRDTNGAIIQVLGY